MDFLIEIFGPDIFSIIHKYTGQIIEEEKYKKVDYCDLSLNEKCLVKKIMSQSYERSFHDFWCKNEKNTDLSPFEAWLDVFYVKIDNIDCKIYRFIGRSYHYFNTIKHWNNFSILVKNNEYIRINKESVGKKIITDELADWYERVKLN